MPGRSTILLFAVILAFPAPAQKAEKDLIDIIEPILEVHCFPCHHDTKRSADISLKNIFMGINDTKALIVRDGKVWMNVVKQIESRQMPPKSHPQMSPEDSEALVKSIKGILYSSLSANNPGVVGVVADVRQSAGQRGRQRQAYVPFYQVRSIQSGVVAHGLERLTFIVRGPDDATRLAEAFRSVVAGVDPTRPVTRIQPLQKFVDGQLAGLRQYVILLGLFGIVAVVLAIVGTMMDSGAERPWWRRSAAVGR